MRKMVVLAAVLAASCKKGDGIDVQEVTFREQTAPNAVIGDLPPEVVGAHDAHVSLWGILSLLASDPLVLNLLENNGSSRGGICWNATPILSTGVDVDYSPCDFQGIIGHASVSVLPGQALAMFFEPDFQYGNRTLQGAVRFERIGGVDYAWTLQPANATGGASTDPLILGIGGQSFEIPVSGHAALDVVNQRLVGWGNVDVTGADGTATVTYGSADPAVAAMDAATPASMKVPFYPVCRCMTGGTMAHETTVTVTEVELSISNALQDAGTIWPDIPVPTSIEVEGKLILAPGSECGRWNASFEPVSTDPITLPGQDLRAAIEAACTANAFGSPESCESVRQGAAAVQELRLNLDATDWDQMADELVERQLDNGFCTI
ncbi:MAG: hypothetical protein H6737_25375 [Alphaproteobacteria bacterium]|nr:hypothetical protein [Alphaproteobacteria bacterium]